MNGAGREAAAGGNRHGPEDASDTQPDPLIGRRTADGSFSLHSPTVGEGFHSASGALSEAREKFIAPCDLARFAPGRSLRVLELAVGTATNTAALIEACEDAALILHWWGLEIDPRPLQLALADPGFRAQWRPATLSRLEGLAVAGGWRGARGDRGALLVGDARQQLPALLEPLRGSCELVLHDAFSPQRCPQLWSLELLGGLAALLNPDGRLITYSAAAAVRGALAAHGLQLASIRPAPGRPGWSAGTVASPRALPASTWLRPLTTMEQEHVRSRAGVPYRDPGATAEAATILRRRREEQQHSGAPSSTAWRRRWQQQLEPVRADA